MNWIPKGVYCYEILKVNKDSSVNTKECPHYKHKKGLYGYCNKIKYEIEDQVKQCGINEDSPLPKPPEKEIRKPKITKQKDGSTIVNFKIKEF